MESQAPTNKIAEHQFTLLYGTPIASRKVHNPHALPINTFSNELPPDVHAEEAVSALYAAGDE